MNIKTKLLIAMFTVGALTAGPAGGLYYLHTKDMLYKNAEKSKEEDLRRMALVVADNMEADDRVPIMNYIKKMKAADSSLRGITLTDKRGDVVAGTDSRMIGAPARPGTAAGAGALAWNMDVRSTVKHESLGMIKAIYDKEVMESDIRSALGEVTLKIIWIAAAGLALGVLAGLLLAVNITKPLTRLAGEARKVDAGNLEIDIEPKGNDEVARVTKSVKDMVVKLKALDELKDDFVNNVSHDLRSPLYTVMQYVGLMRSDKYGKLEPKQVEFLSHINNAAERLSSFVNDVLDVAKIKSGTYGLEFAEANLYDIAGDVLDFNRAVFADEKITAELSGERGSARLVCDAVAVRRVLSNLVGNAVKFTPEGGSIRVAVREAGKNLVCEVSDTGPGIDKADVERIFLRFAQGGKAVSGTGLGLSICRDLVELHGGVIKAESAPGRKGYGSVFSFTLPINKDGGR
jgi:signal transduction histidine kinase